MAATGHAYTKAAISYQTKLVDLINDSIKVALFTSPLVVAQDTNQYFDAAPYTTNQTTGTGYTAGGVALGSKALTASTQKVVFSAANTSWTGATIAAAFAVIYDDTPASNKPLLDYVDLGGTQSVTAATFQITWDATNGVHYTTTA